MAERKRSTRVWFHVSPEELAVIQQKQAQAKMQNREAFLRRIVMEGQVVIVDIPELRQVSALLGHCSGNLNQIAKRLNSTGRCYEGELSECAQNLKSVENALRGIYEKLERINR